MQPILICPGRESYLIYPLSFAMIHSMLLSKLPSLTRFSSQPFASHWCTKKITFLYFWQCFYNKWLISQRFFTSIDCVAYTGQSNILTNPFSNESIVIQRTHNTFTKSSRCAGIRTFLISAKSYSRLTLNYPTYFINTYIPGPHVHFSIHIPRWRINTLEYHRFVIIDSVDKRFKLNKRSLDITNSGNQRHEGYHFPCFNLPTWTPCTMHTMRRSSERHLSSFYIQPSTLSTYHGLKSTNNTPQYFYSLTQSTRF